MQTATHTTFDHLAVVRDEASALIRQEVRAGEQRARLERAVWDAINRMGQDVNEVSAATGLTPAEIRKIADRVQDLEADTPAGVAA